VPSVAINTATSGDNVLLGAQAGHRYRVHSFIYQLGGTATVTFKSGATALTGALPGVVNNVVAAPYDPNGHFTTNNGEDLIVSLSAGQQISGSLEYSVIGPQGASVGTTGLTFSLAKNSGYQFLLIP
jgi:hypothetical protein